MAKPVHSKTYGSISLSTSSLWSGVIMFRCKLPVKSVENIINKLYQLKLLWCTQGGAHLGPGGVLPYKSLMRMCRWMGSHFHDWSDYNGVAFSIELLEWGCKFSNFGGK